MAIPIPDENSNEKELPPPDLIPRKDGIRRPSLENRTNHTVDRAVAKSKTENVERRTSKAKVKVETGESRSWSWKRRFCCLGWVLCFPLCCACYALRERPVDEEDMREDDCLPCYG